MLNPRLLLSILGLGLLMANASAADIDQLVKQLDANEFSRRRSATAQLIDRGVAAIPAIVEAARSESREVAVRAHWILQKQFETDDAETKEAAKAALEQLAGGEGLAARRARQTLAPKREPTQVARVFAPGPVAINGPGAARIQIRQAVGNPRQIQVMRVNGANRIRVEQNGQSIEIQDDANNGIKIRVTEKKDGKQTTRKYEAKDVAELKAKHPDAYKIYEQHGKRNGGIQIRIAQGNPPALPWTPRAAPNRKDHFERVKKNFDDRIEEFEQKARQAEGAQKEMYERMIETFKRQRKLVEDLDRR